jgi:hypothetical protein
MSSDLAEEAGAVGYLTKAECARCLLPAIPEASTPDIAASARAVLE